MPVDLQPCVRRFLRDQRLAGAKLVVAVSGGPDSVCLLHLLNSLREEFSLSLCVAHFDHGLRGVASTTDARYVAKLAVRMGLPFVSGKADVKALQKRRKLTLEAAAREARYTFLAEVAGEAGASLVVTGHTRSDHVETILMHILRGSGLRGLVGLRSVTDLVFGGKDIRIARPMLDITHKETRDYCRAHRLGVRQDASNLDTAMLRNRVRLELMPLLESCTPGFSDSLRRLSEAAVVELDYFDEAAAALWRVAGSVENGVVSLDRKAMSSVHPVLKRHLLRTCFEKLPGGLVDIEYVHIEDMLDILGGPAGRSIDLPRGLVFASDHTTCWLGAAGAPNDSYLPLSGEYPLAVPGVTLIPGWRVETVLVKSRDENGGNPWVAFMDLYRTGAALMVRSWRRGDRFQPLGLGGSKKLAQFMNDARIPRVWRKNIPVVVAGADIAWLAGYRLDERFKVTRQTRRVLRLEFAPISR